MAFTLLCVHPHPDDETLACGGVLATAAKHGHTTVVVTCTGGEEGENLGGIALNGRSLTEVRRDELASALAVLNVTRHHWLGYRDSGMAGTEANTHPDAFVQASLSGAATRLAAVIRQERPDVIVCDNKHGTYGHPDHIMAHNVTKLACELAAAPDANVDGAPFTVPKRYVHTISRRRIEAITNGLTANGLASPFPSDNRIVGADDTQITARINVSAVRSIKQAALACHASQVGSDSFFFNVPEPYASVLFDIEEFHSLDRPQADAEQDLFAGLAQ